MFLLSDTLNWPYKLNSAIVNERWQWSGALYSQYVPVGFYLELFTWLIETQGHL